MKFLCLFLFLCFFSCPVVSAADSTFSRRVETRQRVERRPPQIYQGNVTGVVPRAVRGGNPIQMLNPNAPARYGTAEQSVMFDPYTGKWNGIKFFTIYFD